MSEPEIFVTMPYKFVPDLRESCRAYDGEHGQRCGKRAVVIVWGRLFPCNNLGPRCDKHLPDVLIKDNRWDQWAVYDLRPLNGLYDSDQAAQE